ncbi:flagellar basal body-associated FliL family protein [Agrobacterium larrymoorei]
MMALDSPAPKKQSPIPVIGAIAVLSLLGLGGGWFVGKTLFVPAPPASEQAEAHAAAAPAAAGGEHGAAPAAGGEHGKADPNAPALVTLDPIVTNLGYPADNWVRIELALQFTGPADTALTQELHQEIMAYLRTVSLQQIQGPRGFQYLRDDLTEIVDLRSKGRVSKVLFRTFVIE